MANIAYDPTATGLADGTSWANAYTTISAALSGAAAGDTIYSRNSNGANAETYTANSGQTWASPGTQYSAVTVQAVKNATTNWPPVAADLVTDHTDPDLAQFINYSGGGAATVSFTGVLRIVGYEFQAGGNIGDGGASTIATLDACKLQWGMSSGANRYLQVANYGSVITCKHCELNTVDAGDKLTIARAAKLSLHNCTSTGTGSAGDLVVTSGVLGSFSFKDCDFSSLTALASVFGGGGTGVVGELTNCKMWPGWALVSGTLTDSEIYRAVNCDDLADHTAPVVGYREESPRGSVIEEKTIVRAGDVGDGTTPFSYKLTPVANGPTPSIDPMYSPWIAVWVTTTNTQIEIYVHNTVADRDNSVVWAEVMSPNETAGASGANRVHLSTAAGVLDTPTTLADDTALWNGSANFSQKIAVAIAPDNAGIAMIRVAYAQRAAAPDPLYVSPEVLVT